MLYDLCMITFAKADVDARSLNFVRTCSDKGLRVLYIALQPDNEVQFDGAINVEYIKVDNTKRMFRRLFEFLRKVRPIVKKIKLKNVVFSDLYALPLIIQFNNHAKKIYDSREVYSSLGPLAGSPIKQKIITAMEKRFINYVDDFVVSGQLDAHYLKDHFNTNRPFHVILNLPPYREAQKTNLIREKYSSCDGKFILLYQGALVPGRGLIKMMSALKNIDNTMLIITGEGPYRQKLEEYSVKNAVSDKVIFSGKIAYDKLHEWTCSCDAGLVLFEPVSVSYEYSLPNKLFEFFMAGKPVIATNLPAIREVIKKYPAGKLLPCKLNEEDIVDAVLYLHSEENRSAMEREALKAAIEYNYEAQADKIIKLLRQ